MKVDVHNPQLLITVEIREKIYIYSESIPGPGGMPIGTNGKAMLLLSGGIDSPVAGYMIAKRGVKIDAVYFMHRHIPANVQNRKLWIWQNWWQDTADRSICMWLTLRIFSCISMISAHTMS